jgi:hypothetical protein
LLLLHSPPWHKEKYLYGHLHLDLMKGLIDASGLKVTDNGNIYLTDVENFHGNNWP